jgi:hypothetical protein
VSFDLAIWVGEKPADNTEALRTFQRLTSSVEGTEPPDPLLRACKREITGRYPDDLRGLLPGSIWASAPLDVHGPQLYMNLRWDVSDEALDFISRTAAKHGLVRFDPQKSRVVEPGNLDALRESHETGYNAFMRFARWLGRR